MSASGCSFWPTSRASTGGPDQTAREGGPTLQTGAAQWASPQARLGDNRGADAKRWGSQARRGGWNLDDQVAAVWPSPRANDSEKRGDVNAADHRTGLVGAAAVWPTPASRDHRSPNSQDSQDRRNADSARGQQLPNFVEHLWPTPSAALTNDDEGPETFRARQAALKAKGINGNGAGMPLTVAAKEAAWGTPSTMDARGRTYTRDGGRKGEERPALTGQSETFQSIHLARPSEASGPQSSNTPPSSLRLSPAFVEWLMGWPVGWTIPRPGSLRLDLIASEQPETAWSHWLLRQRSWLSDLSWSYEPAPEAEPEMRQMELL